jgi:hypothetical protein
MSDYERAAEAAIHLWKSPPLTWWDKAVDVINYPLDKAGELAMAIPGVDWVIQKAGAGALALLNDGAAASVRRQAIFCEFQPPVRALEEIHVLDLEIADRAVGFLSAKYKSLALVQGGIAGGAANAGPVAGGAAIATDVVFLLGLNLRAVGEYATYYGFDITNQEERHFALNVLGLASASTDAAKVVAMAQLVKIAKEVAQRKVWSELERHMFVQIAQKIANALAIRLTKAKLAQLVPAAGAAIGGGFNAYYTGKVCDAAYFLYRERFLARKYGVTVIQSTVGDPAPGDLGSGYETK